MGPDARRAGPREEPDRDGLGRGAGWHDGVAGGGRGDHSSEKS